MSRFPGLVEVEPAKPGGNGGAAKSPVYRSSLTKGKAWPPTLEGVSTCLDLFERSVRMYPNNPCLGERESMFSIGYEPESPKGQPLFGGMPKSSPTATVSTSPSAGAADEPGPFVFFTYTQVAEMVAAVGSAFVKLGLEPGARVGVLGANSKEWMMGMQGINRQAMVCVPLYETLGDHAISYILSHSETAMVLAAPSKLGVLAKALGVMGDKASGLKGGIAYWGAPPAADLQALKATGVRVHSWSELLRVGREGGALAPTRPKPEDLCTIMYTSGTTGDPKGVMIRHSAVVSTISSIKTFLSQCEESMGEGLAQGDAYCSYLTLAHIFGRVVEELMLNIGGSIGYWQGDAKKLIDDIQAFRPTLFAAVPRVLERVYKGINDQVRSAGGLKEFIFNFAYNRKRGLMANGASIKRASWLADTLVFNKMKARLGGRVRVIVSGASPLAPAMEEFLRVAMCAPMVQGYGLTETCAASFIADPDVWSQVGCVGPPQPATEMRLEAVDELGYSPAQDPPRGEVCIRGPMVFAGYYKAPEMTQEALDTDGFFHTGDIGEITPSGALRIIDRKKNIFKLSHGEYIAVEKVEGVYKAQPLVEQVWVYGDSTQACIVAVVVPAEKPLLDWAATQPALAGRSFTDVCKSAAARDHVLATLTAHGRSAKLNGMEIVKAIVLEPEQFAVENDLMTPSFKLKRAPLLKRYKPQVDAMYAALAAAGESRK